MFCLRCPCAWQRSVAAAAASCRACGAVTKFFSCHGHMSHSKLSLFPRTNAFYFACRICARTSAPFHTSCPPPHKPLPPCIPALAFAARRRLFHNHLEKRSSYFAAGQRWSWCDACLGNAAAPAILALTPHPSMLANAAAPAILASAPPPSMLTNAAAPAFLASASHPSMLANAAAPAILAMALLPSMLANAAAPAILASAPPSSMLANATAPAILALASHPSMLANAAAPAIFASVPLPSMPTNAAAPAILASVPLPSMLTNAAAPACLLACLLALILFQVPIGTGVHQLFMFGSS